MISDPPYPVAGGQLLPTHRYDMEISSVHGEGKALLWGLLSCIFVSAFFPSTNGHVIVVMYVFDVGNKIPMVGIIRLETLTYFFKDAR